ncbi:hypothetical protein Tco_0226234 [Tanacetum coccineum]
MHDTNRKRIYVEWSIQNYKDPRDDYADKTKTPQDKVMTYSHHESYAVTSPNNKSGECYRNEASSIILNPNYYFASSTRRKEEGSETYDCDPELKECPNHEEFGYEEEEKKERSMNGMPYYPQTFTEETYEVSTERKAERSSGKSSKHIIKLEIMRNDIKRFVLEKKFEDDLRIGSQDAHILEVVNEEPALEISDEDDDLDSLEMDYGENDDNDQQDIDFDFGYNIMRGYSSQEEDRDEESESDYENWADNRPPLLDKTQYSSWASRMLLYIKGKEHGKLLVDSVLSGPFQYGTVVVPRNETTPATVRVRTYIDLTDEEKLRD